MRMKHAAMFVVVLVAVVQVFALGAKVRFLGEGTQLILAPYGPGFYTITVDEACYVRQGVINFMHPRYVPQLKAAFGLNQIVASNAHTTRLFADGKEVGLESQMITLSPGKDGEPGAVSRHRQWFIQFPADYFAVGEHVLTIVLDCRNPNDWLGQILPMPLVLDTILQVIEP